jgi:hypothetical protein
MGATTTAALAVNVSLLTLLYQQLILVFCSLYNLYRIVLPIFSNADVLRYYHWVFSWPVLCVACPPNCYSCTASGCSAGGCYGGYYNSGTGCQREFDVIIYVANSNLVYCIGLF